MPQFSNSLWLGFRTSDVAFDLFVSAEALAVVNVVAVAVFIVVDVPTISQHRFNFFKQSFWQLFFIFSK